MKEYFFSDYISIPVAQAGVITDAKPLSQILLDALSFLLSVAGIVGIIALVVAGIIYLTAGGDEKRMQLGKKTAVASVIGLMIILGALVLVTQIGKLFA